MSALERLHAGLQFAVVERADIEVEILERLGAHAGQLRHRWGRPAQHHPFCFLHALVAAPGAFSSRPTSSARPARRIVRVMLLLPRIAM